jgi:hypothetical protein
MSIAREGYRQLPIFVVFSLDGSFVCYLRAPNRAAAKQFVADQDPDASFWR